MLEMNEVHLGKEEEERLLLAEEGRSEESFEDDEKIALPTNPEEQTRIPSSLQARIYTGASFAFADFRTWLSSWTVSAALLSCAAFLRFLVPSPFKKSAENKEPRDTAWVDGLRGVAAFWVLNTHVSALLVRYSGSGWGREDPSGAPSHYEFFLLPFVRLIYSGSFSVFLFFIISGYALSLSPISRMNKANCDPASAMRSFASSAFRRPIRLYLPSLASTLIAFVLIYFGVMTWAYRIKTSSSVVKGWEEWYRNFPLDFYQKPLFSQVWHLLATNLAMFEILKQSAPPYGLVLWTIAIEMRASIALYLCHLGFFFLRRPIRMLLTFGMIVLSIWIDMWYLHLFLYGMMVAEIDLARKSQSQTKAPTWRNILWTLAAIFSLWLASIPGFKAEETPGYETLGSWNPLGIDNTAAAWKRLAAMLLFMALSQGPEWLRWPFSSPVGRYLGRISFSLYLVHLPILVVIGPPIFDVFLSASGLDNGIITLLAFFGAYICFALPIFYAADRFEAGVDSQAILFGHWLENKLVREEFVRRP